MLKKTKEFRLAEWKKILAEANTSGMSKRAWCKANGISERKLYYWQHRVWLMHVLNAPVLKAEASAWVDCSI